MSLNASPIIAAVNKATAAWQSETSIIADDPFSVFQPADQWAKDSELSLQPVIPIYRNRALHQVLTLVQKRTILKWMSNTAARDKENHLDSKAVSNFPESFRYSRYVGNMKAIRLWKNKNKLQKCSEGLSLRRSSSTITRVTRNGKRTVDMK